MLVSLSVTVNSNSTLASAARSLTTVLLTVRAAPDLRVFVNSASAAVALIVPVSPVFSVVKSSFAVSATV